MNIKKALVVDDSKFAHMTLRKLLVERGIEVDWVGSGEDCMKYLEGKQPEIIFMDVMMPGMDGFETSRAVTARKRLPIVMCSANATEEDKRDAQQSGAVGFLSKPYTPQQLEEVLHGVSAEWVPPAPNAVRETVAPEPPKWEPTTAVILPTPAPAPIPTPAPIAPPPPLPTPAPPEVFASPSPPPTAVAAPAPAVTPTPAPIPHGLTVQEVEQIAERAAWASAEKLARDIVQELVPHLATETAKNVAQDIGQRALQAAVREAQEAAKTIATNTARTAAERTARELAESATAQQPAADQWRDELNKQLRAMREVLIKQIDDRISDAQENLPNVLTNAPEFKPQILQIVRPSIQPLVETTAREAVERGLVQFEEQHKGKGGSGAGALIVALLALIAAGVAIANQVLKFF